MQEEHRVAQAISSLYPEANLVGFVVVMEWLEADGERSLTTMAPAHTPPWEIQGWLWYLNSVNDQAMAPYEADDDEE